MSTVDYTNRAGAVSLADQKDAAMEVLLTNVVTA